MPYIGRTLGQGTRSRFLYTATAGQTTFSGSDSQSNTLAYADNNGLDCFQNGVLLKGGGADYTATTGTSVVLTTGASVNDVIEILVYDVFAIADHVKKSGDTITGQLNANGGAVFNEDSADVDFRVESNGNANMLVIDGGNDIASIGRAVNSSSTLAIQNKDDTNNNAIDVYNDNGNRTFSIQSNTSGDAQFKAFKNDGTQGFTLSGDGSVTNPLQPMFSADGSSSYVSYSDGDVLAFNNERFDIGGNYDTSTYTFTVPVTGKYFVAAHAITNNLFTGGIIIQHRNSSGTVLDFLRGYQNQCMYYIEKLGVYTI